MLDRKVPWWPCEGYFCEKHSLMGVSSMFWWKLILDTLFRNVRIVFLEKCFQKCALWSVSDLTIKVSGRCDFCVIMNFWNFDALVSIIFFQILWHGVRLENYVSWIFWNCLNILSVRVDFLFNSYVKIWKSQTIVSIARVDLRAAPPARNKTRNYVVVGHTLRSRRDWAWSPVNTNSKLLW